jgi:hypothetical protein
MKKTKKTKKSKMMMDGKESKMMTSKEMQAYHKARGMKK